MYSWIETRLAKTVRWLSFFGISCRTWIITLAFWCLAFMITSCSSPSTLPSSLSLSASPPMLTLWVSCSHSSVIVTESACVLVKRLRCSMAGSLNTFGSDSPSRLRHSTVCAFYIYNQIARGILRAMGKFQRNRAIKIKGARHPPPLPRRRIASKFVDSLCSGAAVVVAGLDRGGSWSHHASSSRAPPWKGRYLNDVSTGGGGRIPKKQTKGREVAWLSQWQRVRVSKRSFVLQTSFEHGPKERGGSERASADESAGVEWIFVLGEDGDEDVVRFAHQPICSLSLCVCVHVCWLFYWLGFMRL